MNKSRRKFVYGNKGNYQEKEEAKKEELREGTEATMLNINTHV